MINIKIKYKLIECPYCFKEQDFINGVELMDIEYVENYWIIDCIFCNKEFYVNYKVFGKITLHLKSEPYIPLERSRN